MFVDSLDPKDILEAIQMIKTSKYSSTYKWSTDQDIQISINIQMIKTSKYPSTSKWSRHPNIHKHPDDQDIQIFIGIQMIKTSKYLSASKWSVGAHEDGGRHEDLSVWQTPNGIRKKLSKSIFVLWNDISIRRYSSA